MNKFDLFVVIDIFNQSHNVLTVSQRWAIVVEIADLKRDNVHS